VFINSMTVQSAFAMFKAIAVEMLGSKAAASVRTSKHAEQLIVNHLTSPGKWILHLWNFCYALSPPVGCDSSLSICP